MSLYFLTGSLYKTFLFLLRLPKHDWLYIYSVTRYYSVTKRSRKETTGSAGCPCRKADKECSLRCGCGQILQCNNGKNEATERENAQRLPGSVFDRHRAEIQQSEKEIMVNYAVD